MAKDQMCDGDCPICDPESYVVTVDASFIKLVRDMYNTLNRIKKNYYTTEYHNDMISQAEKGIKKKDRTTGWGLRGE